MVFALFMLGYVLWTTTESPPYRGASVPELATPARDLPGTGRAQASHRRSAGSWAGARSSPPAD